MRRPCPSCGSPNRPDAPWCGLCLTALTSAPLTAPSPPRADRITPASSDEPPFWWMRFGLKHLAIGLAVGLAMLGPRMLESIRTGRMFSTTAAEAVADPRGFKFRGVDPDTGEPIRFDACSPVHYVVHPANAPRGGLKDIHTAVDKTAKATGIEFVFDGLTDEPVRGQRPLYDRQRYGRRWSPILIAWAPNDPSIFPEDSVGVARTPYLTNADGRLVYVTGTIFLRADAQLGSGFEAGHNWGRVIMHELGHTLGLDHVHAPAEVMHPGGVSLPGQWGPGDLAGLRRLGHLTGCLDVPALP